MRKALSVLGVFILGVVCACILAFEPVKTHVATELQHYRITTKVDALTEIYSAKYWNDSVGAKEVTAFPQIDLETIEPDQYEDALSTAQSCVETAKADVESALADFNERVKTHNFVSNQLSRVKKANAPVQTLDDALVYTDRMKAIILSVSEQIIRIGTSDRTNDADFPGYVLGRGRTLCQCHLPGPLYRNRNTNQNCRIRKGTGSTKTACCRNDMGWSACWRRRTAAHTSVWYLHSAVCKHGTKHRGCAQ